jgi:hypothetical protein
VGYKNSTLFAKDLLNGSLADPTVTAVHGLMLQKLEAGRSESIRFASTLTRL